MQFPLINSLSGDNRGFTVVFLTNEEGAVVSVVNNEIFRDGLNYNYPNKPKPNQKLTNNQYLKDILYKLTQLYRQQKFLLDKN